MQQHTGGGGGGGMAVAGGRVRQVVAGREMSDRGVHRCVCGRCRGQAAVQWQCECSQPSMPPEEEEVCTPLELRRRRPEMRERQEARKILQTAWIHCSIVGVAGEEEEGAAST